MDFAVATITPACSLL